MRYETVSSVERDVNGTMQQVQSFSLMSAVLLWLEEWTPGL